MKAKLAIVALMVLVAAVYLRKKSDPSAPVTAPEISRITQPSSSGKPVSLRSLLAAPTKTLRSEMGRVSPECREFEDSMLGLALHEIDYPPKIERLPNPHGCSPDQPRVAKMLRYYSKTCAGSLEKLPDPSLPKKEWMEKFGQCQAVLLMTRSILADVARGSKPPSEMNDLRELADTLVAELSSVFTDMSPGAVERLQAAADRMLEIDPRLLPAVKAGTVSAVLDAVLKKEAQEKGTPDAPTPNWEDLEKRIAHIEELDPKDGDLDSLHRFARTSGLDPERVRQDSLSRVERAPGDAGEQQLLAWANWKLGRGDEAKSALARAKQLDPKNTEIQGNWDAIHRPGAKPDDFKVTMRLGFNLTDLLKD